MKQQSRETWLDVAKGLSIIFVVMGHSGDHAINEYLSWFRMPLFFMLSGFLFKPVHPDKFYGYMKKKGKVMLIPYFSYGLLIAGGLFALSQNFQQLFIDTGKLLYGGLALAGPYGVFWFITCLLLTQIAFGFISRFHIGVQVVILGAAYGAGHALANHYGEAMIPWNADVALITLTYYAIGYYMKGILSLLVKKWYVPVLFGMISLVFVTLDFMKVFHHETDLKYKVYGEMGLNLVIPVAISITICSICYWVAKVAFSERLAYLGRNTITIMYLHIPLNIFLKELLNVEYGLIAFTLIGVLVPLGASIVIRHSDVLSRLYLGRVPRTSSSTSRASSVSA